MSPIILYLFLSRTTWMTFSIQRLLHVPLTFLHLLEKWDDIVFFNHNLSQSSPEKWKISGEKIARYYFPIKSQMVAANIFRLGWRRIDSP